MILSHGAINPLSGMKNLKDVKKMMALFFLLRLHCCLFIGCAGSKAVAFVPHSKVFPPKKSYFLSNNSLFLTGVHDVIGGQLVGLKREVALGAEKGAAKCSRSSPKTNSNGKVKSKTKTGSKAKTKKSHGRTKKSESTTKLSKQRYQALKIKQKGLQNSICDRNNQNDDKSNQIKKITWILLVEDEGSLRKSVGKYLAKEGGHVVTSVTDAQSALLICKGLVRPSLQSPHKISPDQIPDCLILDIHLPPPMNGLRLLEILRSDSKTKLLPVILLTARGKVQDRIGGYDAGADGYISKPFEPGELLSLVGRLLERTRSNVSEVMEFGGEDDGLTGNRGLSSLGKVTIENLKRELSDVECLLMRKLDVATHEMSEERYGEMSSNEPTQSDDINAPNSDILGNKISYDYLNGKLLEFKELIDNGNITEGNIKGSSSTDGSSAISSHPSSTSDDIIEGDGQTLSEVEASSLSIQPSANGEVESSKKTDAVSGEINNIHSLTTEDETVLELLEQGMTNQEIASQTQSTVANVAKKVNYMLEKMRLSNRTELMRWWKSRK